MIADSAIIYDNVVLGKNITIEPFVIIGIPFKDYNGEKTIIGDNAVIRSHSVIYAGNCIGDNFQTGNKANVRELNKIGNDVSIGTMSVIEHHVTIDHGVRIHSQVFIPEYSILDEKCWIGPNTVLTNAKYPQSPDVKDNFAGVHICSCARIGANTTLLPGVVIGKNSVVGAGSVVTKDVSENLIVAGNPARKLRDVFY